MLRVARSLRQVARHSARSTAQTGAAPTGLAASRLTRSRHYASSFTSSENVWGASPSIVGSANLDWGSLGFDYVPTNGHVRYTWKDGSWDSGTFVRDPYISVHILGNVFHYGQALFEGFKAFHMRDGSVRACSDNMSQQRMNHGCRRFRMPDIPKDMWTEGVDECVRMNAEYVPPYGSGGALYVRPFVFGSGPKLGLGPSPEYTFIVFCNPTGSYYQAGQAVEAIPALVNDMYDRAAPLGCGDVKAAGNYAADLESMRVAKEQGFPISLYLDAKERKYVEEFNTSNFVAITKDGKYLTPSAPRSILASNTNKMLQVLAADMGIPIEVRPIDFEAEVDNFAEVGGVGTAVVVTALGSLTRDSESGERRVWKFGEAKVLDQLREKVRAIQVGEDKDKHGWMRDLPLSDDKTASMQSIYPGL